MRAIVCTRYGPPEVLQLREVAAPIPKDHEVRIRVHAASVTTGDCELRGLRLPPSWRILVRMAFGLRRPRAGILGQELAGEVDSVGPAVTRFQRGDKVFAATGFRLGAYAEFACLSESGVLATMPSTTSYAEAAAVPMGGLYALPLRKQVHLRSGQKVLIIGAGGSIGTFAVQLAKLEGAEVTAVDRAGKLNMLRSIGADHVLDYMKEDFTATGETYDVIFDVVGKRAVSACLRSLKEGGTLILGNPRWSSRLRGWWVSRTSATRVVRGAASYRADDLAFLKSLLETGRVRPVIDRRYPLEQAVDAHRYVDTGEKLGNVLLTVVPDD